MKSLRVRNALWVGFGDTRLRNQVRNILQGGSQFLIKHDFFTKNRVKTALRVGLVVYFFVVGGDLFHNKLHEKRPPRVGRQFLIKLL